MTPPERQAVTSSLCELALATGGQELDQARIVVYLKHLDQEPVEAILSATKRLMRSAKYFPSVGEIIAASGESMSLRAAEAWRNALKIASSGRYSDRDGAATPAIRQTVRLVGGWDRIGFTPTDRLHFVEKQFLELYPAVEANAASRALACESLEKLESATTNGAGLLPTSDATPPSPGGWKRATLNRPENHPRATGEGQAAAKSGPAPRSGSSRA